MMRFVILRILKHNELGMFHAYRRMKKEKAKQRAINFDSDVIDRIFPTAKDGDNINLDLRYETDGGIESKLHRIKRQEKNWRLEGNCPKDKIYDFVDPGCLFAMVVDAGKKPAIGAWAVYPADHKVTKAIQSHAESSQLTAQSMIALYGNEGRYTLGLLCSSKPNLFGSPKSGPVTPARKNRVPESGPVHLPPDPKRLVKILASVGHSLPSAVADIVDNAISHDATEIDITFREPDQGHGRWMAITDNGRGMDSSRLAEAMRIGSITEYEPGDLGKYGYGLKGASWSQAESFTVVSKRAGKPRQHLSWDADTMDNWEASRTKLDRWVEEEVLLDDHGTCVFWREMRPPKRTSAARGIAPYTAEVRDMERHLGLVFHRFIEGKAKGRKAVKIRINGEPVPSNNPVGHRLTTAYDKKPIKVPTTTTDAYVDVQAFLLPSEGEVKSLHGNDLEAIRKDLDRIGLYGRRNESQGLYVYRNDRLIQWGGWHEIWTTSDEKTKLARVTVDFAEVLDDQFAVNISKQKVTLPQQLQEHIKKLAEEARNDSRKKYMEDKPKTRANSAGSKKLEGGTPEESPALGTTKNDGVFRSNGGTKPKPNTPGFTRLGGPDFSAEEAGVGEYQPTPTIAVRKVRSAAFSWRISKSLTGQEEIQVSESEAALQALSDALSGNNRAVGHLAEFLKRLDKVGVQKLLSKGTGS